jgi:tetratricopeptide (TPR) repeat protein
VSDPAAVPGSRADDAPPLVGRERELALLARQLTTALAGRGGLVLLGGEAGVGKTSVVEALAAEAAARGALVLVGRCYDLTETPPYGPWAELFGGYPAHTDLPPLPAAFAGPGEVGGAAGREALFRQVRDFLAAVAAQRPLVVLLDDLHWADPASLDLLRVVARQLAGLPLLLLATYRADELARGHPLAQLLPLLVREAQATRLAVRPLDRAGVEALVAGRYPLPAPDAARLVAYLHERSEGNPFFAGELLRALEEAGVLAPSDGGWTVGDLGQARIPGLLHQVIDGRVARLGEDARGLLAIAAVIGQEVPLAVWARVADVGEEALLDAAERAVEARLLVETADGSGVRFAHALVREALYEGILGLRRRALHRRVGEALEREPTPDPNAVAYHFRQAGDARAVEWLLRAGERAQRAYAWLTAAERYEAALALLPDDEATAGERGWLHFRLARMRSHADPHQGLAHLDAAVRLATAAEDSALVAWARSERGLLRAFARQHAAGLAELAAGVAAAEALSPAEQAQLDQRGGPDSFADLISHRGTLVTHLAWKGHYAEALEMGERYVARIPPAAATGEPGRASHGDAYLGLGIAYATLGRPDDARRAFAQARVAYRAAEDHFKLGLLAAEELGLVLLVYAPERVAERHQLAAEIERAMARASGIGVVSPRLFRLPLLLLEGEWAEARALVLEQSAAGYVAGGREHALVRLGYLARAQGEPDLAWAQVREVPHVGPAAAPGEGPFDNAVEVQRLAAALALDAGDLPAARAWLAAHDRWLAWSGAVLWRAEGQLGWAAYHRSVRRPTPASRASRWPSSPPIACSASWTPRPGATMTRRRAWRRRWRWPRPAPCPTSVP